MRLDIADAASGASRIIGEDFLRLDIADAASGASRIIGEDACASFLLTRPLVPRGSLVRTLAPRCHVLGRIAFFCLFLFFFSRDHPVLCSNQCGGIVCRSEYGNTLWLFAIR